MSGTLLKSGNSERGTDEKPRVLGDNRGQCDAVDCHAEHNNEQQIENDIRDVDRQEYRDRVKNKITSLTRSEKASG